MSAPTIISGAGLGAPEESEANATAPLPGDVGVAQASIDVQEKAQSGTADEAPKEQAGGTPAPGQTAEAEAKDAAEAQEPDPANVNGGSTGTTDSVSKIYCKCCSLRRTVVIGDSMPDEEFKFGGRNADPYGTIVRSQICHASVQVMEQVILAIPMIIQMTVLALLPVNGNIGATTFQVVGNGVVTMALNMSAAVCPVIWTDRHRAGTYMVWVMITMAPLIAGNAALKWSMFTSGAEDMAQTQFWNIPAATVMAIAMGKMMTVPGWYPKVTTSVCVCGGGLSRAIGTCCLYYAAGFFAVLILSNWVYYDNTIFSMNEGITMALFRPIAFTTIKKLIWAVFSIMSWTRHPFMVKAVTLAASAILGFATAVAFTKTRTWVALILFILVNWSAHFSRMWVFQGGRFSSNCFLLGWYKNFMVWGKPIASSGKMKLRELRGFENIGQSWGTTFAMAMFIVFYPIAKIGFGDDSMPMRFFFPTDLSIVFLVIAYLNEVVLDVHTQITTIFATKSDYAGHFSLSSRSAMTMGVMFVNAYIALVVNAGHEFERNYQEDLGNYAEGKAPAV